MQDIKHSLFNGKGIIGKKKFKPNLFFRTRNKKDVMRLKINQATYKINRERPTKRKEQKYIPLYIECFKDQDESVLQIKDENKKLIFERRCIIENKIKRKTENE